MSERNPPLSIAIDRAEANRLLGVLISACPGETAQQILSLFIDEGAPYQSSALFDYAFVIIEGETSGTINPIVGFRLRDADEFITAIRALYEEKVVAPLHDVATSPKTETLTAEDRR